MWISRVNVKLPVYGFKYGQQRLFYKLRKNKISEAEMQAYTNEPEYPPIKDTALKARKQNETAQWHECIALTNTVEEKLIAINMPRYYGYKVVHLNDTKLPYNILPAIQYYTRTVFDSIQPTAMPTSDDKESVTVKVNPVVKAVESEIQDCIVYSHALLKAQPLYAEMSPEQKDYKLGQLIVEQISRVLTNALAAEHAHLREVEVDYEPRHEAFWCVGGIDPPKNVVKSKEGRKWQKDLAKEPVNRLFQYAGRPYLCLRHGKQLTPWQAYEQADEAVARQIVPFKLDPRTLGYSTTRNVHVTNIPGFWPGSSAGFGYLMFCPRNFLTIRPDTFGVEDSQLALHAQAIQSSFAWLVSLAAYNGFNTYNDLTYPMNTQTVVTNGQNWSFYDYQLNTMLLHGEHAVENAKVNYCRGTTELTLYKEVSDGGKCIGFNEDVLERLVNFYVNAPRVQRDVQELQPYLNENHKYVASYAEQDKREFLEKTIKHISSNRGRHLEEPEIYLWEKIYKIDHKTRVMEPRRRFFELEINPWKRTLDQHQKKYIPRSLRVNGPRDKRNKWKPTFYPS